jgi:hypothetical protein
MVPTAVVPPSTVDLKVFREEQFKSRLEELQSVGFTPISQYFGGNHVDGKWESNGYKIVVGIVKEKDEYRTLLFNPDNLITHERYYPGKAYNYVCDAAENILERFNK